MRILGLSCGRRMGNSELMLIEALAAAQEMGVDVAVVRLHELEIEPCRGCISCVKSYLVDTMGRPGECPIRDDLGFFSDQVLEADGVIIAAPLYTGCAPGPLKVLSDRMGPSHDVAFHLFAKRAGRAVDERFFKPRAAATMAVGGAVEADEQIGNALMQESFLSSMMMPVIDYFTACNASEAGQVLLNDGAMARARRLGQNVASSLGKTADEVEFLGDDPGVCPICHQSVLMLVQHKQPVLCPLCGIRGRLTLDGDDIRVYFDEDDIKRSRRSSLETRLQHIVDIGDWGADFERATKQIGERMGKYSAFDSYCRPGRQAGQ
jgi:multimeric flavodoxin WrbA